MNENVTALPEEPRGEDERICIATRTGAKFICWPVGFRMALGSAPAVHAPAVYTSYVSRPYLSFTDCGSAAYHSCSSPGAGSRLPNSAA